MNRIVKTISLSGHKLSLGKSKDEKIIDKMFDQQQKEIVVKTVERARIKGAIEELNRHIARLDREYYVRHLNRLEKALSALDVKKKDDNVEITIHVKR